MMHVQKAPLSVLMQIPPPEDALRGFVHRPTQARDLRLQHSVLLQEKLHRLPSLGA